MALNEIIGMFIDDGAVALLTIALIAGVGLMVKLGMIGGLTGACLLFLGCLIILAESVARVARRKVKGLIHTQSLDRNHAPESTRLP
ncbi:hypothetical protein [Rhizobium grahamii]